MIFQNKTVLLTGGTGSLGKTLVRHIMSGKWGEPRKVIVFSRDEDKQHSMKLEWKNIKVATDEVFYYNYEEVVDFRIGDVRDFDSLNEAVKDSDMVIHAAALKQVPVCEYFPVESIKTNVMGAQNVIRAARANEDRVEVVLGVSTDKACKPVNSYGMCKAMQERLLVQANLDAARTRFICVRYGNVIASRGSVIPLFKEQISNGGPVTITVKEMTRFWLTLNTAVGIIFDALRSAQPGDIYVPDVPSANVVDLAEVMIGDRKVGIEFTGIRPGEKLHEILISEEEISRTIKRDDYYVICPILPELQREKIARPVLDREFSSADHVMNRSELTSFLQKEGHLDS